MKASVVIARMCKVIQKHGDVNVRVFPAEEDTIPVAVREIAEAYALMCRHDSKTADSMLNAFRDRIVGVSYKIHESATRLRDL